MNKHPLLRGPVLAVVLAACACCAQVGWAQSPAAADPSAAELLFWETQTRTLLEFAPYLSLPDSRLATPIRVKAGSGYPASGNIPTDWQVTMAALPDAPITVPAGRFQASRVELKGTRGAPSLLYPARFQVTMWYAPEVKRYVRIEHRAWNGSSALAVHEVVELLEFSGIASQ